VAPIAGVLNRVAVEKGEYVQEGTLVAEIVDIDTAKVVVYVPERDVQYVENGAETQVFADVAGQEEALTGVITYMSELADIQTRATRLEISVENRRRLLRSGQIVRAKLTRRVLTDVIMIPLAAVIPLEDAQAVYVVEAGEAERRDVELGLIRGRRIQVLSGLEPGDRLIVLGHRFVGPGQPVQVVAER
jgi:membrane fusion protein (multidrug efflux system)